MVWRSGIFEFCTSGLRSVIIEVVAPCDLRFASCGGVPHRGVRNPIILRGARRRLFGNSRLDAVRSRAILDGFMFIDFSFLIACNAESATGCLMVWLSTLSS